jgi:hypothetical protein
VNWRLSAATIFAGFSLSVAVTGCEYLAVQNAPAKQAATTRTQASLEADALFWKTLHSGNYNEIPGVLTALTGAYLVNPSDAVTAAHIGWMHIWRLSESGRLDEVPPTITDDAILARRYFQEAVNLDAHDARFLGFLASITVVEGSIQHDERVTRRGYYLLLDSINAWPEFNLFTAGYTMSPQPSNSARFKEALDWQWRNLDACVDQKVDRNEPSFAKYMSLATTEGNKRACWNTSIAPHNVEGFFLNMGDMLVKAGDWETGRKIYANAMLSPTYGEWKFREVLERRIADATENIAVFNAPQNSPDKMHRRLMVGSPFACMACHQQ